MWTGFEAMRLGGVIYFVPFFFVVNAALVGNGPWHEILITMTAAIRVILVLAGLMLEMPAGEIVGCDNLELNLVALVLALPTAAWARPINRQTRARAA